MLLLRSRGFDRLAAAFYQIERSLRFNDDDTPNLTRTPGSATNRTTWTWSGWFKSSGKSGSPGNDDSNIVSAGTDGNNYFFFALRGDGTIRIANAVGGSYDWNLITTPVYRDPTAWYHFVIQYDSTQGTASNRVRFYVNGTQVTSFSTASYPSASYESWINNNVAHYIGRRAGGPGASEYADGYLTEINFIDGTALTPSSFGETNATTGASNPIEYSGSYGTNGFYLNFSDNSNTTSTTLGKDYSGNGNNWTPNNFSVTAGAGNDSMTDTPTNYGTGTDTGGVLRGNYCTLNPVGYAYVASPTLANGNLDWSTAGADRGALGTFLISSGKYYFETTIVSIDGGDFYHGVEKASNVAGSPYTTLSTRLYYRDGRKTEWNPSFVAYGDSYTAGDVVGCAIDMDNGKIWWSKNGTFQASGNPAAGTGAAFTDLAGSSWLPFGLVGSTTHSSTWNFGQRAFAYTPPTGFLSLCTQNIAEGSITTSGTFTGNANADGPVVALNGVPTTMTINSNAVTFGTHADKLAMGFKLRTSSASYNTSGSNSYSVSATSSKFKYARAQVNP